MMRCDKELRELKNKCGVFWGDVADAMGIGESTLYKALRHKMTLSMKNEIIKGIKAAEEQKGADGI